MIKKSFNNCVPAREAFKEAKILSSLPETNSDGVPGHFLNPNIPILKSKSHLPHWHQDCKIQFVTFRLADSLPQEKLNYLKEIRNVVFRDGVSEEEKDLYYEKYGKKVDEWLDAGAGSCIMRKVEIRQIVEQTLLHFNNERYKLHAFVVMPNHVHALLELINENKIGNILHSWKRFSAKAINGFLGRTGVLWQHESFDRMIRHEAHYLRVVGYIKNNNPKIAVIFEEAKSLIKSFDFAPEDRKIKEMILDENNK